MMSMSSALSGRTAVIAAILTSAVLFSASAIHRYSGYQAAINSDFIQYDGIARSLLDGEGYAYDGRPTLIRGPGFPTWVAFIYALTGRSYGAVVVGQVMLSVLLVYLTALLGRRLGGDRASAVAAWLAAVSPLLGFYAGSPYSEPLYTALSLLGILAIPTHTRPNAYRQAALAGALIGLSCFVRSQNVLVPILLAAWWVTRARWRGLLLTLAFCASFAAVVAPWTARNYLVSGEFVLIHVNAGHTFNICNNKLVLEDPETWGYFSVPGGGSEIDRARYKPWSVQIAEDRREKARGMAFLRENIEEIPRLVVLKFARFFGLHFDGPPLKRSLQFLLDLPLLPLSMIGIILIWRTRREELAAPLAALLAVLATILVFCGGTRFRATITPIMVGFSAVALVEAWGWYVRTRLKRKAG